MFDNETLNKYALLYKSGLAAFHNGDIDVSDYCDMQLSRMDTYMSEEDKAEIPFFLIGSCDADMIRAYNRGELIL